MPISVRLTCCEVVIGADDGVQVRLQKLEDDVKILEGLRVRWQHDVLDVDDVGVLEDAQQLDFPQDARRVGYVLENVLDPLDGNLLACEVVYCCADRSIAAAEAREQLIFMAPQICKMQLEFRSEQ